MVHIPYNKDIVPQTAEFVKTERKIFMDNSILNTLFFAYLDGVFDFKPLFDGDLKEQKKQLNEFTAAKSMNYDDKTNLEKIVGDFECVAEKKGFNSEWRLLKSWGMRISSENGNNQRKDSNSGSNCRRN